jgi:23S rRNA pseudouridine2605 synthase
MAEAMIRAGRVTVNGERVTRLGTTCDPARDVVAVDGKPVRPAERHVYLAVNKPRGYVSTVRDRHAARRVVDLAPPDVAGRVKPVGRLDKESEGLLILTDDGTLIQRLTHPRYHVEKEYSAGVLGHFDRRKAAALVEGVELDDGPARAIKASIVRRDGRRTVVRIVLGEGRKRQIRRMLAALGCRVDWLRRVRIGPVALGPLAKGSCRHLTEAEVRLLYRATERGGQKP